MPTKHGPKVEKFYHSSQWKDLAADIRIERHGRCEICGKAGNLVHHTIPLTEFNVSDPDISLNRKRLQLLCRACHREVHADIDSGFARKTTITIYGRDGSVTVVDKKQNQGENGNARKRNDTGKY